MLTTTERLDRHEFLKALGLRGAALLAVYCTGQSLTACGSGSDSSTTPTPIPAGGITVDLTSPANAALLTVGGYIVTKDVVVANTSKGYVAVTVVCTHNGNKNILLRQDQFLCTVHGAQFDLNGKGLNALGSGGLKTYTVTKAGNVLTIV
jgi:cytochrome b6-f complex iron-sulfur subunit